MKGKGISYLTLLTTASILPLWVMPNLKVLSQGKDQDCLYLTQETISILSVITKIMRTKKEMRTMRQKAMRKRRTARGRRVQID